MPERGDQKQVFSTRPPGNQKKSNSAEEDVEEMETGDDEIKLEKAVEGCVEA